MKRRHANAQGITLIELLVSMAVLSLVLAGLYGLLDAANKSYRDTRALVERQQTARQVLNYVLYRLREVDGSGLVKDPRYCEDCHTKQLDHDTETNSETIPCEKDVRIPRRTLYLNMTTEPLPTLARVETVYQDLPGANRLKFWADLLPITAPHDEFTDSPAYGNYSGTRNGIYDLTSDVNGDGDYAPGEDAEVLYYDLNDNGEYDYYGEYWEFGLQYDDESGTFQLVETLSFTQETEKGGILDTSLKNKSTYSAYTSQPIAYGITGFGVQPVLRYTPGNYPDPSTRELEHAQSCGGKAAGSGTDTCHGILADVPAGAPDDPDCPGADCWLNIFDNQTAFSYERFVETHPWWNTKALSIEIATTEPQKRKFMKMKQLLIPRNLEVNQEYYTPE